MKSIEEFEKWYFKTEELNHSKLEPPELVTDLLVGARRNAKGLCHACGIESKNNKQLLGPSQRSAISLLVKLMDYQQNKSAKLFRETFIELCINKVIHTKMSLEKHITDPTSEPNGFFICNIIYPVSLNVPKLMETFLRDNNARHQFENWLQMQTIGNPSIFWNSNFTNNTNNHTNTTTPHINSRKTTHNYGKSDYNAGFVY